MGFLEVVGVLVQADGAVVNSIINSAENYGNTPLHVAANHGHAAVVGFLMRAGARLSPGYYGRTALHEAQTHKSAAKVVSEILAVLREKDDGTRALGTALAQRDASGINPLHAACLFGNLRCRQKPRTAGVLLCRTEQGCYRKPVDQVVSKPRVRVVLLSSCVALSEAQVSRPERCD